MPTNRITTNFLLEDEEAFINDYHQTIIDVLKIPDYDRLIVLEQKENGFYQPTNTDGNYIIFEISLFPGRSLEIKRELYKQLIVLSEKQNTPKSNVRITLHEIERENWGLRGGQAACDIDFSTATDY